MFSKLNPVTQKPSGGVAKRGCRINVQSFSHGVCQINNFEDYFRISFRLKVEFQHVLVLCVFSFGGISHLKDDNNPHWSQQQEQKLGGLEIAGPVLYHRRLFEFHHTVLPLLLMSWLALLSGGISSLKRSCCTRSVCRNRLQTARRWFLLLTGKCYVCLSGRPTTTSTF